MMDIEKPALSLLPDKLAICRLPADAAIPEWFLPGSLTAMVRTADELSIVCPEKYAPHFVTSEPGWRCLKIEGPLDFLLVGILAGVLVPLANAGISIFSISTFDTDYVLINEEQVESAIRALKQAGFKVIVDERLLT